MEDDRITEELRAAWQCEPPPGLRERVLAAAIRVAEKESNKSILTGHLRHALALAGLMMVASAYLLDGARVQRLSAGAPGGLAEDPGTAGRTPAFYRTRAETLALLAAPAYELPHPGTERSDHE